MNGSTLKNEDIYNAVHDRYASAARSKDDYAYGKAVASEFGYSVDELESIPKDSNLGLSCGNPTALANIKEVRLRDPDHIQIKMPTTGSDI